MSIDQATACTSLSHFYVERQKGQWQTVANCLEELIRGKVTKLNGLAAAALGVAGPDEPIYSEVERRANKLNDRVGKAGAAEVEALARAAIGISASISEGAGLAAHAARIGFNRPVNDALVDLINAAISQTDTCIGTLRRKQQSFDELTDPIEAKSLQESFGQRDR